jgi:thiamine-phosphate pyrophosphorylase
MQGPLPRPAICLVTSGAVRKSGDKAADDLMALASRAVAADVDIVQIREPALTDGDLVVLARRIVAAAEGSRTTVVVNDRADVALAASAGGVHLRGTAMAASRVRSLVGPGFLIGRSVHTIAEARAAEEDGGVDYLIFGTVFPSAGKPKGHPVAGVEGLGAVCGSVRLPVLAIGGMTAATAAGAAAAGAAGVAAIGAFTDPVNRDGLGMPEFVNRLRRAFDTRRGVV